VLVIITGALSNMIDLRSFASSCSLAVAGDRNHGMQSVSDSVADVSVVLRLSVFYITNIYCWTERRRVLQ